MLPPDTHTDRNDVYSTQKNPDDVVITLAIRTPLCKGKKGGLKDVPLDGIVFKMLEQVVRKSNLDPQMVEDVCLGNVRKYKQRHSTLLCETQR